MYESCNLFQPLLMLALTVIYFQVDYSFKDETDQERYVFGPNANSMTFCVIPCFDKLTWENDKK